MPVAAVPMPDNFIAVRAGNIDSFINLFFTAHHQFFTVGQRIFFVVTFMTNSLNCLIQAGANLLSNLTTIKLTTTTTHKNPNKA